MISFARRTAVATAFLSVAGLMGVAAASGASASEPEPRARRAAVPASFSISGSGFGHGVGMSQYGAFAMAVDGATAEQILEYYYRGSTVDTAQNPWSDIAVQVFGSAGDASGTTLRLSAGEWRLRATPDATTNVATGGPARTIALSVSDGEVRATIKQSGTVVGTVRRPTLVMQWSGTRAWPGGTEGYVSVAGAHGRYRHGTLTATVINGRVNVVNDVRINDEYLWGIDEMPSLWGSAEMGGRAALEAQAIVARNYAILHKTAGLRPECACHVYDDTRSQNFTGWRKENGEAGGIWTGAVDATRQDDPETPTVWVVRAGAGNAIAETPFFARSGRVKGVDRGTASNRDVWGSALQSHLVHRDDPYSFAGLPDRKWLAWTDVLGQSRAQRLFGLGRVATLKVVDRYPGGQVRTIKATSPSGQVEKRTKRADAWRVALGVPGAWVTGFTAR